MNKLSLSILIAALMCASIATKTDAAAKPQRTVIFAMHNTDNRVKALESVFEKHNSPLLPYAKAYVDMADKYNVDWKLLPSISGLESSFGLHQMPGSHNSYGWGGGLIYFNSYEEGIQTITSTLRSNYYDRGADTVYKIAPIYAESPTWAPRVTRFMDEIESEYQKIGMTRLALTI